MKRKPNKSQDGDNQKFSKHCNYEGDQTNYTVYITKQADPEAVRYFSVIANLFESSSVDVDDKSVICSNALEETRGKEVELSTDYKFSHTLQTLLEGCDVDHLCSFLINCGRDLALIAMDKSGSHVIETPSK